MLKNPFLRVVVLVGLLCAAPVVQSYTTTTALRNLHHFPAAISATARRPCSISRKTGSLGTNPKRTAALFDRPNKNEDNEFLKTFQIPWDYIGSHQKTFIERSLALIIAYVGTFNLLTVVLQKNGSSFAVLSGSSSYKNFLKFMVMGQVLAAGLTSIVARAAAKNRLASATYKRLNGVLAIYGVTGVLMGTIMGTSIAKSAMTSTRTMISCFLVWWMLLSFATVFHSFNGYAVGVTKGWGFQEQKRGWRRYLNDSATQAKTMAKHVLLVPFPRNLQALVYWAASATLASLNVMTLVNILKLLGNTAGDIQTTVLGLAQCGLMGQLTGMYVILKDAADRGRLEGGAFIGLNCLASVASAFLSAALRQGLCGSVPLKAFFSRATGLFSISTGLFAIAGLVAKKRKHKYHDESLQNKNAMKLSDDFPLEE